MHFCDSVHPPEFVKTRRNKSTHNFHTLPPRMHPKALIFPSENFLSFSSARKIFVLVRSLSSILFRSLLGENTKLCERTPHRKLAPNLANVLLSFHAVRVRDAGTGVPWTEPPRVAGRGSLGVRLWRYLSGVRA